VRMLSGQGFGQRIMMTREQNSRRCAAGSLFKVAQSFKAGRGGDGHGAGLSCESHLPSGDLTASSAYS